MSGSNKTDVVQELQSLINADQLNSVDYDPKHLAQCHLILAAKLLETAGYEVARTNKSGHTIPLLSMSSQIAKISRML